MSTDNERPYTLNELMEASLANDRITLRQDPVNMGMTPVLFGWNSGIAALTGNDVLLQRRIKASSPQLVGEDLLIAGPRYHIADLKRTIYKWAGGRKITKVATEIVIHNPIRADKQRQEAIIKVLRPTVLPPLKPNLETFSVKVGIPLALRRSSSETPALTVLIAPAILMLFLRRLVDEATPQKELVWMKLLLYFSSINDLPDSTTEYQEFKSKFHLYYDDKWIELLLKNRDSPDFGLKPLKDICTWLRWTTANAGVLGGEFKWIAEWWTKEKVVQEEIERRLGGLLQFLALNFAQAEHDIKRHLASEAQNRSHSAFSLRSRFIPQTRYDLAAPPPF
ncbi:hypothetical protein JCM3765_003701 [Sporobolomyces pararoseus]